MKINLRSLRIVNFKGIKEFETSFTHITNLYGDNATGKTSVFDAFLWLFFGKNSDDAAQFEVKRLDDKNKFIKDLESEVSAIIHIDDKEVVAKKVLRQKWVRRRGELQSEYNGDENVYFWNDVPCKEAEFKTKVKNIVEESIFRLITNPFYFNSIKWQERRNILIELGGEISNDDVLASLGNKASFKSLIAALNQGKTIDEYKKDLAAKKKKIKDEAESIPSRIDEVRRGLPAVNDFAHIRSLMASASEDLADVQGLLNSEVAQVASKNNNRAKLLKEYNDKVNARQQKVFDLKSQSQNIYFDAKQKAKESGGKLAAEIKSLDGQLIDKKVDQNKFKESLKDFAVKIKNKEDRLQHLREYYEKFANSSLEFNESEFVCPSCKQSLPSDNIEAKKEELTTNFNKDKIERLQEIEKEAAELKGEIEVLNTRTTNGNKALQDVECDINEIEDKIKHLKEEAAAPGQSIEDITSQILSENKEYTKLQKEIAEQEALEFIEPVFEEVKSDEKLLAKRTELNEAIASYNKELAKEEQIAAGNKRIEELESQETRLAQELANLEGAEYAILQFTKAKVDALERKINGKFKYVKFKMFEEQVNGGEKECCETLVNSNGSFVPFSDANNAAKINAGIDIINALCEHYNVSAPIFLDNRESVTKVIDTDSQIVNLIVSERDKQLRVA